jgi:hypothetical protein
MEEIGIQHDFYADGCRHYDAMSQSKTKELCLVGDRHRGSRGRDGDVLHADHLAHDTTGGVGRRHERGLKAQAAGSHDLQVAEERIG